MNHIVQRRERDLLTVWPQRPYLPGQIEWLSGLFTRYIRYFNYPLIVLSVEAKVGNILELPNFFVKKVKKNRIFVDFSSSFIAFST